MFKQRCFLLPKWFPEDTEWQIMHIVKFVFLKSIKWHSELLINWYVEKHNIIKYYPTLVTGSRYRNRSKGKLSLPSGTVSNFIIFLILF